MAHGQNQSSIAQDASGQGSKMPPSPEFCCAHSAASPGQTLANNFVTLHFELVRPNPAGSDHNFVIQLDGLDPVNTSETEYTFTVIRSGKHTVAVMEVDANGTRCRMPGGGTVHVNRRRVPHRPHKMGAM